jgi:hypothetical protein
MASAMTLDACLNDISNTLSKMTINANSPTKTGVLMVVDECDPQYFPLLADMLQLPTNLPVYRYNTKTVYQTLYFYVSETRAMQLERLKGIQHLFTAPRRSNDQPNLDLSQTYTHNRNLLKATFEMERIAYIFSQN